MLPDGSGHFYDYEENHPEAVLNFWRESTSRSPISQQHGRTPELQLTQSGRFGPTGEPLNEPAHPVQNESIDPKSYEAARELELRHGFIPLNDQRFAWLQSLPQDRRVEELHNRNRVAYADLLSRQREWDRALDQLIQDGINSAAARKSTRGNLG